MQMNRRTLITGLISLVAAPAIVRVSSIMPVKQMIVTPDYYIGKGTLYVCTQAGATGEKREWTEIGDVHVHSFTITNELYVPGDVFYVRRVERSA